MRSRRSNGEGGLTARGTWKIRAKTPYSGKIRNKSVAVAEEALGRALPHGAQVHHIDGDHRNNLPINLVICPNQAYHQLLHRRAKSLQECGQAHWRKCNICKKYDDPKNLQIRRDGHTPRHSSCRNIQYQEKL